MKCGTTTCEAAATRRFTWPGRDEQLACEPCAARARGVAAAIGLHLQVLPLVEELLTFELEPLGELHQQLIDGMLASGMRETKCTACGCQLYTRGDDDRCPPCRRNVQPTEHATDELPGFEQCDVSGCAGAGGAFTIDRIVEGDVVRFCSDHAAAAERQQELGTPARVICERLAASDAARKGSSRS